MQTKKRKDHWSAEDDSKLAEIVLRAVGDGQTQLAGFEEAAQVLSRTKQACGFRWNKTLRSQYDQVLEEAKRKPKQMMRTHLKHALTSFEQLAEDYNGLKKSHDELRAEHEQILHWLEQGFMIIQKRNNEN